MSYQYDLFISYRRSPETYIWISEHFIPLLKARLEMDLGRRPLIYLDDQVESGTSWPVSLGVALGTSRVLLILWTANYLRSRWCAAELSHMLQREHAARLRTVEHPHGIVIPVFIHDGKAFPPELQHIQYFEIQKCYNLRMSRESPLAEQLDTVLAQRSESIAACIDKAPDWRPDWQHEAASQLFDMFYKADEPVQQTVPRFSTSGFAAL